MLSLMINKISCTYENYSIVVVELEQTGRQTLLETSLPFSSGLLKYLWCHTCTFWLWVIPIPTNTFYFCLSLKFCRIEACELNPGSVDCCRCGKEFAIFQDFQLWAMENCNEELVLEFVHVLFHDIRSP